MTQNDKKHRYYDGFQTFLVFNWKLFEAYLYFIYFFLSLFSITLHKIIKLDFIHCWGKIVQIHSGISQSQYSMISTNHFLLQCNEVWVGKNDWLDDDHMSKLKLYESVFSLQQVKFIFITAKRHTEHTVVYFALFITNYQKRFHQVKPVKSI